MTLTLTEVEELSHIKDNVKRSVDSLELCWSCERVGECEPSAVDDGPPVWLCAECASRKGSLHADELSHLVWPLGV